MDEGTFEEFDKLVVHRSTDFWHGGTALSRRRRSYRSWFDRWSQGFRFRAGLHRLWRFSF
ncbi:MAG TPA: hypothetical protein VF955_07645 [Pyrinomonadaceae bacterium]